MYIYLRLTIAKTTTTTNTTAAAMITATLY
jgi:hypothetical protein